MEGIQFTDPSLKGNLWVGGTNFSPITLSSAACSKQVCCACAWAHANCIQSCKESRTLFLILSFMFLFNSILFLHFYFQSSLIIFRNMFLFFFSFNLFTFCILFSLLFSPLFFLIFISTHCSLLFLRCELIICSHMVL